MTSSSLAQKTLTAGFRDISHKCYAAMQSETALALTAPYHVEELERLEKILSRQQELGRPFDNFVAIGSGNLRYMDVALRFCKTYTAIDPHLDEQVDPDKKEYLKRHCQIRVIGRGFDGVTKQDLPEGSTLFFFLFNVFPYIDDALATQKRLVSPGDGVIISSWNDGNFEARRLQQIYYDYLNEAYPGSIARSEVNGYIDDVEKKSAQFCSGAERVRGRTTDILALKI